MRWIGRILVGVVVLVVLLAATIRLTTFHPPAVAGESVVCPDDAPTLEPGQSLEVMNWNVQYFAGKDYVFWYDLLDESGPDERPSPEAITATFDDVVRVIAEEDPDVIVLQEVDDGAARTDGEDQLARLLAQVDDAYACHASAFYWRAAFVPHPRIMGSVGMKLSTISRYRIDEATRYQLAQMPSDLLTRQFDIRRAILETRLPVDGADDLVVLNTHLDAFAQGTDTMQRQVAETRGLLDDLTEAGEPWVIGGDFNLLPPGRQYDDLGPAQQAYYEPDSELAVLTDAYPSVPSLEEANGPDREAWYTHVPNDPAVDGPDRTIDFLFHAPSLTLGDHDVRHDGTLDVSDHLPVVATYDLPEGG
jgi:endonuclease/exonuclease/phosphatase family metal-dependent hydrolase